MQVLNLIRLSDQRFLSHTFWISILDPCVSPIKCKIISARHPAHQSASEYGRTSHILDTLAEHERGAKAGEMARCHGSAQAKWDWRVLSDSLPALQRKRNKLGYQQARLTLTQSGNGPPKWEWLTKKWCHKASGPMRAAESRGEPANQQRIRALSDV